jgi:hypothetical protein
MSTLASSNQNNSEITMIFSEDEEVDTQGNLVTSIKINKSKERKLSNEMLPPRAMEGAIMRPCARFASGTTIFSKPNNLDQQPLQPMTILGFLQSTVNVKLQGNTKKRVEKAGLKSLEALSLTASLRKTGSDIPSFTLG